MLLRWNTFTDVQFLYQQAGEQLFFVIFHCDNSAVGSGRVGSDSEIANLQHLSTGLKV